MRDKRVSITGLTYYSGLDELRGKSPTEKADWLRGRFEKIVINPLSEVRHLGRDNPAIWDLNLGVVTIICSAIEALGSFYQPDMKDELAFKDFVKAFMDPAYQEPLAGSARTLGDVLYGDFRCGLAHGLTIEGHEVTTRPKRYIREDAGYVSVDLWSLFEDMRRAFERYMTKVHTDEPTQARFVRRFDKLFVDPYPPRAITTTSARSS